MTNKLTLNHANYGRKWWFRTLLFVVFLLTVNLVAGYIAVTFHYPSLYNVDASFAEYALPLPFYWGMLHIPSMLIYGIPLLILPTLKDKHISYFRLFCLCSFLLLLLGLNNKVPFLLFPNIDALFALVFSLIIVPPTRKNNPVLVIAIKLVALLITVLLGVYAYSFWQHQPPKITISQYEDGLFELTSINVKNDFHKQIAFQIDLKKHIVENQICKLAQPMAHAILHDYPFDNGYNKVIIVRLSSSLATNGATYYLGEISLNQVHKEENRQFACYMKYKSN